MVILVIENLLLDFVANFTSNNVLHFEENLLCDIQAVNYCDR